MWIPAPQLSHDRGARPSHPTSHGAAKPKTDSPKGKVLRQPLPGRRPKPSSSLRVLGFFWVFDILWQAPTQLGQSRRAAARRTARLFAWRKATHRAVCRTMARDWAGAASLAQQHLSRESRALTQAHHRRYVARRSTSLNERLHSKAPSMSMDREGLSQGYRGMPYSCGEPQVGYLASPTCDLTLHAGRQATLP